MTLKNMLFAFMLFGFTIATLPIQPSSRSITSQARRQSEAMREIIIRSHEETTDESGDTISWVDNVFAVTIIGATFALAYYTLEDSCVHESALERFFT
jgi:ribosomal protein L14